MDCAAPLAGDVDAGDVDADLVDRLNDACPEGLLAEITAQCLTSFL